MLISRRNLMAGKPLPYLRRVAYLESHGTEWIDCGATCENGRKLYLEALWMPQDAGTFFGANSSNSEVLICHLGVKNDHYLGGQFNNIEILKEVRYKFYFDFTFGALKLDVDGATVRVSTGSTNGKNLYLFGCISSTGGYQIDHFSEMRIYSFGTFDIDGVPVLNLIPVLDLSGRPAMYDEVSGQFFYNQGTGEFTWGELGE